MERICDWETVWAGADLGPWICRYKAVDEGSFRVLVRRAREAEVWMLVAEQ